MTSQDDLRLRPLAADETERLFSFYRETLGNAEHVITLYEWRLRGRPSSGGIDTYVAERKGRLLGAMNAVPTRLSGWGELFQAAWQQDSIVHPEARGRGVGSRLTSYAARRAPIALAKGTVEPMYRLRKRAGFRDVPGDTFLVRPLRPLPGGPESSLKRRVLFPVLWLAGRISQRVPTRLETTEIERFDADFDRLADKLARRPGLRLYKPSGYLNWRYFTCPVRNYRVFATLREGEPSGAVVLRTDQDPGRDAWIVDLILDETDRQTAHTLVNAALNELGGSGAPGVRTFATCPRLRRLLLLRGFVPTSDTPHFTYHVVAKDESPPKDPWCFFHGDADTELLD